MGPNSVWPPSIDVRLISVSPFELIHKPRLAGSDQPLHGLNLIGKATLNVLKTGGRHEITDVKEKRLHVCHEHIGFTQEIVRLRSGDYIQKLNLSEGDASSVLCSAA
jgi:hypothetical protein